MIKDEYLVELLKGAKNCSDKPEEQYARAGRSLMAYLSGCVGKASEDGDPVACRIRVQIHSMMPHLINTGY